MMRTTLVMGSAALLLSLLTGCSGLSRPDEIRVAGEIMANPPAQIPMPGNAKAAVAGARGAPGAPGQAPRRGG